MRRASQYTLIVLIFSLLFTSCQTSEEKRAGDKKVEQLRQMAAAELPVHQSFSQKGSMYSVFTDKGWSLHFYYQSPASYDEVRDFYIKELAAKGWSKFQVPASWGNVDVMSFTKGEYHIRLNHSVPKDLGWDYAIDYSWEKP